MAISNATDVQALLGKSVTLTYCDRGAVSEHRGTVIAVIAVHPGSRATASLMLDEGSSHCDYFDLEDIQITAVL